LIANSISFNDVDARNKFREQIRDLGLEGSEKSQKVKKQKAKGVDLWAAMARGEMDAATVYKLAMAGRKKKPAAQP
jgi:hypothetical protein